MKAIAMIKPICQSKTVSEMLSYISWRMVSAIALFPLLLFAATPLYQLVRDSISPPQVDELGFWIVSGTSDFSYIGTVDAVSPMILVLGCMALLLYLAKMRQQFYGWGRIAKGNIPFIFFVLLVLCTIASACFNGFTSTALVGDFYRDESLLTYFLYVIVYFFCGTLLCTKRHKRILFYSILGISLILAYSAMVNLWLIPLPVYHLHSGVTAVFYNSNHYGYFLTIVLALSSVLFAIEQHPAVKAFCLFTFLVNSIVLVVNDTFGCYLAVWVALVFQLVVLWICNRKFSWVSLIPLGGFLVVTLVMSFWYDTIFSDFFRLFLDVKSIASQDEEADSAGSSRWRLWKGAIQCISEEPLFGFGIDGTEDRLNNRPHNEYLQYAAFFGIPALICYLGGLLSVYLHCWRKRYAMDDLSLAAMVAAFGYLASAFFGNTMYYTTPYFFMLLGATFLRERSGDT